MYLKNELRFFFAFYEFEDEDEVDNESGGWSAHNQDEDIILSDDEFWAPEWYNLWTTLAFSEV